MAPRTLIFGTAVGTLALLVGCSAAPEPTPTLTYVPIDRSLNGPPEPTPTSTPTSSADEWEWVPGPLRAGPTPGTVLGPTGKVLRLIPADPARSFKCRALTDAEPRQLALATADYDNTKPMRAVDLAEGYSVVGFWNSNLLDGPEPAVFVSGERFTFAWYNDDWYGSHTFAGVAFEDGPKAMNAVLDCIS